MHSEWGYVNAYATDEFTFAYIPLSQLNLNTSELSLLKRSTFARIPCGVKSKTITLQDKPADWILEEVAAKKKNANKPAKENNAKVAPQATKSIKLSNGVSGLASRAAEAKSTPGVRQEADDNDGSNGSMMEDGEVELDENDEEEEDEEEEDEEEEDGDDDDHDDDHDDDEYVLTQVCPEHSSPQSVSSSYFHFA